MNTNNSQTLTPLGLDDGHYAIKLCAGKGKYFSVESMICSGQEVVVDDRGQPNNDLIFHTGNNQFYTITAYESLAKKNADTTEASFALSNENRALGYYAMNRAIEEGFFSLNDPLFVMTGLPVNRFYTPEGKLDKEFIDNKRQSLFLPIYMKSGKTLPTVTRHEIVSEAVASFFDAAYDFDGNPNEDFLEIANYAPTAIIDIGGKTLDLAVVKEGGAGLHYSRSGTADAGGALFLYDSLDRAITPYLREAFPKASPQPLRQKQLDMAARTGRIIYYGKPVDVSHIVNKELDAFADRVRSFVEPNVGNGSDYGKILFVGGGANLLHDRTELVLPNVPEEMITVSHPNSDLDVNSSFSNARGLYKAALISSLS